MNDLGLHMFVIPGLLILGWLSRSVKVAGFHTKVRDSRESFHQ